MSSPNPIPKTATRNFSRFENRVAATASGGKFCDGWILAVIGVVLPLATTGLGFSPVMEGLIGSGSLFGLFVGGLAFGWVTDRLGRKVMFMLTLLTFLVCSILQFFVVDAWQLFALRVVMGMAIGADYAIGGAMVAEFTSLKKRGPKLAEMLVWWYAGFSLSATLAILALNAFPDIEGLWRWILASSAVPALVMFLARIGLPESPRWLASRGRMEEARAIAEEYLDPETREDALAESTVKLGFGALFSRRYIRKTALVSIFWMAQITPFFAIYVFLPRILTQLDIDLGDGWSEVVLYLFLLIGCVAGVAVVNRIGRRKLLIIPFIGMGASLLVLALWQTAPSWVVITCFIVFAFAHAAGSVLQMLYPSELFPTEIRATAVGFGASMSRIGAAVSTFLLPMGLTAWGVGPTLLIGVAICALGLVVSIMWAPETTGLKLTDTASIPTASEQHRRTGARAS
ncbi:MFS transporter [Gulosibacter sp. 10]|uniref:MFS transporter n=1 Tax=Gulosibacter sp. 10 TaxID=1255570 RepID=UPI0015957CD4|nr:MFS transporter [Gulosibacter sp. 10]